MTDRAGACLLCSLAAFAWFGAVYCLRDGLLFGAACWVAISAPLVVVGRGLWRHAA